MDDRIYKRRFSEHNSFWALCAVAAAFICIYIFLRINKVMPDGRAGGVWLLICVAMAGLSYTARRTSVLHRSSLRRWADITGGLWLLFAFFAFIALVVLEGIGPLPGLPTGKAIVASFVFSAAVIALGVKQANTVRATNLTIETDKLPRGMKHLRIVQLTDLHLSPYSGAGLLAQILRRVKDASPDMVVVTGDVADGRLKGRGREISMFRRIRPKYGFFAVTGNHEYYDDVREALTFMRRAGMRVLHNEALCTGGIVVAGADDRGHMIDDKWGLSLSETMIVNTKSRFHDKFILLLRHRPVVEIGTEGMFDLQLSGHTHGGQIFPLFSSRLIVRSHPRGLKKLRHGSLLYTSNGAGYVGPPVRLMAPPEITVIDLVRK